MSAADLLPPNASAFEKAQSATDGARILAAPAHLVRDERQPTTCGADFVGPLAWERSVHFWAPDDEAGNRARIASSFADHGAYGAPATLEAEIALDTGETVVVREFNEIASYFWPEFCVDVETAVDAMPPDPAPIRASALARKNVRDLLVDVRALYPQPPAALHIAAACDFQITGLVLPFGGATPPPQIHVGAAIYAVTTAHIAPIRS